MIYRAPDTQASGKFGAAHSLWPQRANLMCGNFAEPCFKRCSTSATLWPVSKAVELATARSTAFRLGFLRGGVEVFRIRQASGVVITEGFILTHAKRWSNGRGRAISKSRPKPCHEARLDSMAER